jgi:hypothetical protein
MTEKDVHERQDTSDQDFDDDDSIPLMQLLQKFCSEADFLRPNMVDVEDAECLEV